MIEITGTFGPSAANERCGAFTHAVVSATNPQTARELANTRLSELGFTIIAEGEEVEDITGWVGLDESICAAVERLTEPGQVEFGIFETYPLDDVE